MASTSSSFGSSYSDPILMQSPQSEWGLQLSHLLDALGQSQYNWARDQFNNGMGITNQTINQFMDMAGKGAGLANTLLSEYRDKFQPIMDRYLQQAESYNSEARQRFEMGRAESTVGQADQAAMDSAERKLQSFGINPNSGRYQDLILSSRIQDAAARAGAGTQASVNTANTGRQMLQTGAQMGQNVPGMTVNALQSGYSGLSGAQNSLLGMLNTGATLANSATPLFNASSGAIKMPPVGNVSRSTQSSNSSSSDPSGGRQGSGGGSGAGGGSGSGAGGPGSSRSSDTQTGPGIAAGTSSVSHGGYPAGSPGGTGILNVGGDGDFESNPYSGQTQWADDPYGDVGMPNDSQYSGTQWADDPYGDVGMPNDSESSGTQWADDPQGDVGMPNDGSNSDFSDYGAAGDGSYFGNTGDSGGWDSSGDDSYAGEFAQGGPIKGVIPTTGGHVPASASPSRGRQTDDVGARLNVGEFVMPRDVVAHKGTEFFRNVIEKSRRARTGMAGPPAQPKMKPAMRLKPSFVSHRM